MTASGKVSTTQPATQLSRYLHLGKRLQTTPHSSVRYIYLPVAEGHLCQSSLLSGSLLLARWELYSSCKATVDVLLCQWYYWRMDSAPLLPDLWATCL